MSYEESCDKHPDVPAEHRRVVEQGTWGAEYAYYCEACWKARQDHKKYREEGLSTVAIFSKLEPGHIVAYRPSWPEGWRLNKEVSYKGEVSYSLSSVKEYMDAPYLPECSPEDMAANDWIALAWVDLNEGYCDRCKKMVHERRQRRDYEEGLHGRIYHYCVPCCDRIAEQERQAYEEEDDYDYNDYDYDYDPGPTAEEIAEMEADYEQSMLDVYEPKLMDNMINSMRTIKQFAEYSKGVKINQILDHLFAYFQTLVYLKELGSPACEHHPHVDDHQGVDDDTLTMEFKMDHAEGAQKYAIVNVTKEFQSEQYYICRKQNMETLEFEAGHFAEILNILQAHFNKFVPNSDRFNHWYNASGRQIQFSWSDKDFDRYGDHRKEVSRYFRESEAPLVYYPKGVKKTLILNAGPSPLIEVSSDTPGAIPGPEYHIDGDKLHIALEDTGPIPDQFGIQWLSGYSSLPSEPAYKHSGTGGMARSDAHLKCIRNEQSNVMTKRRRNAKAGRKAKRNNRK